MRAALLPLLFALAIALAPAAQACHLGPGIGGSAGVQVTPRGPTLAVLALPYQLCKGPVTLGIIDQAPIGGGREDLAATLDILAPKAGCIALSCGGSDPFAAVLRFTGPEVDLLGVFEYPHVTAGFAFAGTVHGLPAAFAASAA